MSFGLLVAAYIAASILFVLSLGGLSHQETSQRGNAYGIIGMVIAVVATLFALPDDSPTAYIVLGGAILVGTGIGGTLAQRVQMTAMPELVAILHSFVGAAAALAGIANHLEPVGTFVGTAKTIHSVEIFIGVFIGSITFTGSVIAFGKLRGSIGSKPLLLPGRHYLNLLAVIASVVLGVFYAGHMVMDPLLALLIMTAIACLIGVHMVMAIGGADMPVVVSMLNSYSGWAAAAAGFMLSNDLLIITGALVGSSGAILSYIMCAAMNRSFVSVIFGGFGANEGAAPAPPPQDGEFKEAVATDVDEAVEELCSAGEVIIVPGYGMAVAQAQHPIWQVTRLLIARGCNVRFAIHPVAGRLPGHMNVLLAEANVPYDIVMEMDEINEDFPQTDIVLVVGANDIVNPSAQTDPASPIAGMPVLEAWNAGRVIVMKRSLASGYAGVGNPLFFMENTRMLFGDARDNTDKILDGLKE